MKFEEAIKLIKLGKRMQRKGWIAKNRFVFISFIKEYITLRVEWDPEIAWIPTLEDMSSDDWEIFRPDLRDIKNDGFNVDENFVECIRDYIKEWKDRGDTLEDKLEGLSFSILCLMDVLKS